VCTCVFLLHQEFFDMILVNNPSFYDGGVTVHVFYAIPHIGLSVGGPCTIPVNTSKEMVGYHSTTTSFELHQFTRSHKASMWSVQIKYLLKVPLRMVLNRHGWGLPPWLLLLARTKHSTSNGNIQLQR
jgi:hypothetical protein